MNIWALDRDIRYFKDWGKTIEWRYEYWERPHCCADIFI
jgi:hypothetical protein